MKTALLSMEVERINKMEDKTEIRVASQHKPDENKTESSLTSQEIVQNLAADYSEYLSVDATKEQEKFNESIEEMLTKLDEFCTLVDMIRSDTSLCLNETLPKIQSKCGEIQKTFDKIDRLELFVAMVRDNVDLLEVCVNKAEDDMGSFSGLKKMLSSFVSPKRTTSKEDKKSTTFKPPDIFNSNDFFPKKDTTPKTVKTQQDQSAQEEVDGSTNT